MKLNTEKVMQQAKARPDTDASTLAVVMAGGSGTRLWPLSQKNLPKQFLNFFDSHSLFQKTVLRIKGLRLYQKMLIIGNLDHRFIITQQMLELGLEYPSDYDLILETEGKNTLTVALTAALYAQNHDIQNVALFPADHNIDNLDEFGETISIGISACNLQSDKIVMFGVDISSENAGYGYAKVGEKISDNLYNVAKFTEKPSIVTIQQYRSIGGYYINTGIFIYNAKNFIATASGIHPRTYQHILSAYELIDEIDGYSVLAKENLREITPISIDHGILENTDSILLVLANNLSWQDIGSWDTLQNIKSFSTKNSDMNITMGNVTTYNSQNSCFINKSSLHIGAIDLENITVVADEEAVLIMPSKSSQKVRDLVSKIEASKQKQFLQPTQNIQTPCTLDFVNQSQEYQTIKLVAKPGIYKSFLSKPNCQTIIIAIKGCGTISKGREVKNLTLLQSLSLDKNTKYKIENLSKSETLVALLIEIR